MLLNRKVQKILVPGHLTRLKWKETPTAKQHLNSWISTTVTRWSSRKLWSPGFRGLDRTWKRQKEMQVFFEIGSWEDYSGRPPLKTCRTDMERNSNLEIPLGWVRLWWSNSLGKHLGKSWVSRIMWSLQMEDRSEGMLSNRKLRRFQWKATSKASKTGTEGNSKWKHHLDDFDYYGEIV